MIHLLIFMLGVSFGVFAAVVALALLECGKIDL